MKPEHKLIHRLAETTEQLGKAVLHCTHHEMIIASAIHALKKGKTDTALQLLTAELHCYRLYEDEE